MKPLDELLQEAVAFHGHLCPGQVLGVRMAMAGCVVRVRKATDLGWLAEGPRVLHCDRQARCQRRGRAVASRTMLARIGSILGADPAISKYCLT